MVPHVPVSGRRGGCRVSRIRFPRNGLGAWLGDRTVVRDGLARRRTRGPLVRRCERSSARNIRSNACVTPGCRCSRSHESTSNGRNVFPLDAGAPSACLTFRQLWMASSGVRAVDVPKTCGWRRIILRRVRVSIARSVPQPWRCAISARKSTVYSTSPSSSRKAWRRPRCAASKTSQVSSMRWGSSEVVVCARSQAQPPGA